MDISNSLKYLRNKRGITQNELAEATNLSLSAIISYETGRRKPNARAMAKLEAFFNVGAKYLLGEIEPKTYDKNLSDMINEMGEHSSLYREFKNQYHFMSYEKQTLSLSLLSIVYKYILSMNDKHLSVELDQPERLEKILLILDKLNNNGKNQFIVRGEELTEISKYVFKNTKQTDINRTIIKTTVEDEVSQIDIKVFDLPASAGFGNYLEGESPYEMLSFDADLIPYGTNFGIRISGDSMEPEIEDGSIAWVKEQLKVEDGDIGIFILDGEAYCKKLSVDYKKKEISLISLNEKYSPIIIKENNDLRTVGKVLS